MSWDGIAENIISDILFLLIPVVLGWAFLVITRRTKLLGFFGVREPRRMVIYLSNLRIVRGGAIGIDDRRRSYQGAATAFLEMAVANRFRDVFNYLLPSLSDRPGVLSKLLVSDVQVQLIHSPLHEGKLERSSPFITLGSPAYNIASRFAEERLHSQAQFRLGRTRTQPEAEAPAATISTVSDSSGEGVPTLTPVSASGTALDWLMNAQMGTASTIDLEEFGPDAELGDTSSAIMVEGVPPITDETYGFVERVVDHGQDRFVFYVAGISELATAGAAHFLVTEWTYLQRKYPKGTPFLVVLRFETNNYKRWSIVFER
jgi:hypothetical protein